MKILFDGNHYIAMAICKVFSVKKINRALILKLKKVLSIMSVCVAAGGGGSLLLGNMQNDTGGQHIYSTSIAIMCVI